MLSVGLTGGIAAGKTTVAVRLMELGAVVVDADVIARDVVAPGSPGLAAVADRWGPAVIAADGTLDRAAMGAIVFAEPEARRQLGRITHPLIFAEHVAREAEAVAQDPAAVVVHDVPLIVENDAGPRYHLVLVVDAPVEMRVARMVADRGMSEQQARARVAAQATEAERRVVADIWLDNSGGAEQLRAAVDDAWHGRILPYEENVRLGRGARSSGGPVLRDPAQRSADGQGLDGRRLDERWAAAGTRLVSRLGHVLAEAGVLADISHVGSTAVPNLVAKDVVDLQIGVDDLDDPRLPEILRAAGFPVAHRDAWDHAHPADGTRWPKLMHRSADPGRPVNLHVRTTGSEGWRWALAFRDVLRDDDEARAAYAEMKSAMARRHEDDDDTAGYAEAKEPWFAMRGEALVRARVAAHAVEPDLDLRRPPAA